ncbi:MAG: NAD(P)/FAD-dependent oxidoreductase [Xenococcaceae cyanobacterium MO_234.B1]|nr:NAD(P)/FAD-dependent oxidoreductase [Xenococcaceae cyanobacterium MO_234.B1]
MNNNRINVLIAGGGFGGLYTALYFSKFSWVKSGKCQITLVEPKDKFLFTPLLYEILTDELQRWEIAPNYQKLLLKTKIQWFQDKVTGIDLKQNQAYLATNSYLTYDYLVLALGRKTKFANIPGLEQYALTFRSITDAEILKEKLQIFKASAKLKTSIAVIGAGANGVELACKVYDKLLGKAEIYLIDRSKAILKNFGNGVNKAAKKALAKRNIQLLLSTEVQEITANSIILKQQHTISEYSTDLVLWTAGTETIDWINNLPCQRNNLGKLLTRPTLQLIDYPEVIALGDLADIRNNKTTPVPTTAQAAYQQASCAANNLQAILQNKRPKRFYYLHLGDMLTLGKGEAIISSFGINLSGKLADLLRRLIYIQRLPTMRHRLQVFKNLLLGKKNQKI